MKTIYVLNGPNLNLLGTRDPAIYGHETLDDVEERCQRVAQQLGVTIDFRQTNHEGELVEWLHEAGFAVRSGDALGAVLNAGAYTHTSLALADAITGVELPVIEVHISNVHAREAVRHHSFISPVAAGIVVGLGTYGYEAALHALVQR